MDALSVYEDSVFRAIRSATSSPDEALSEASDEPGEVDWNMPGFAGNLRVGTVFGDLPIQALRIRDEIRTASGAIALVQSIDKFHLDEDFLRKHPSAHPVRVRANSLGIGIPGQDMLVSPRQEICPDPHVFSRHLQAIDLCKQSRAHRVQTPGLTYFRFHCGHAVTIRVEGVWVRVAPWLPGEFGK
ncbi:MAG: Hint domain-containing protein [Pseudomonadota bacterium]